MPDADSSSGCAGGRTVEDQLNLSSKHPQNEAPVDADNPSIVTVPKLVVVPPKKPVTPAWPILGLDDVLGSPISAPPWVIKDLVMAETITLVSAHPHGMKSLSWLFACLEGVATGKVFGHFDAPDLDSVLFIETEDPEWLVKKRIKGFSDGLGLGLGKVPGFHFTCPGPFDLLAQEAQIKDVITKFKLKLIVLSTLQNLLIQKDWKNQEDMQPLMSMLVRLSRLCPIVLITHSPHDKRMKRAAGTITIGANCATHIHYEKHQSKAGETVVRLRTDSKVGADETDFTIKLVTDPSDPHPVGSVRRLEYAGKGLKRGMVREDVLAAIEDDPYASDKEIASQAGCSSRYVQKIRKEKKKGN